VKRRTIVIGGISREYEHACQLMLDAGIEWLKAHPDFSFKVFKGYANVTGIVFTEDATGDELLDTIAKAAEGGASGAMVQAVASHLNFIHNQHQRAEARKMMEEAQKAGATAVVIQRDPNAPEEPKGTKH